MMPSFLLFISKKQDCVFLVSCSPLLIGGGYFGAVPTALPKKLSIQDFSLGAMEEIYELLEWYRSTTIEDERKIDPQINEEVKILEKKCVDLLVSKQDSDEYWISTKNGKNLQLPISIDSAGFVSSVLEFAAKC